MITDEEYRKIISKLKLGTPETRIIVNKWNWRVYEKYKFELFEYLEDKLNKALEESIEKELYMDKLPPYSPPKMIVIPPLNNNAILVIKEDKEDA